MNIIISRTKAWENDQSAPVVFGFLGNITSEVKEEN